MRRVILNIFINKKAVLELTIVHAGTPSTDLVLAFNEKDIKFPLVNCAAIHVDAIVESALS